MTENLDSSATPLTQTQAGATGKIAYLSLTHHGDLHRLLALGLVPGVEFRLHQTYPSFVLELGETTLALETEIAQHVFVRCE